MMAGKKTTIAEKIVNAQKKGAYIRHTAYLKAMELGEPFNIGREIKSFIFRDGSVIEFGAVVVAQPF